MIKSGIILEKFNEWYNDRKIKQKIASFNPIDIGESEIKDFIMWLEWTKEGHGFVEELQLDISNNNKETTEIILWMCTDCGESYCGPGIAKPIPCQCGCRGLTMIPVKVCIDCELPMYHYENSSIEGNGVVHDVMDFYECPNCGKRK